MRISRHSKHKALLQLLQVYSRSFFSPSLQRWHLGYCLSLFLKARAASILSDSLLGISSRVSILSQSSTIILLLVLYFNLI